MHITKPFPQNASSIPYSGLPIIHAETNIYLVPGAGLTIIISLISICSKPHYYGYLTAEEMESQRAKMTGQIIVKMEFHPHMCFVTVMTKVTNISRVYFGRTRGKDKQNSTPPPIIVCKNEGLLRSQGVAQLATALVQSECVHIVRTQPVLSPLTPFPHSGIAVARQSRWEQS